tara:strand:- start:138 stop:1061 length:924 start_codon:yes stop_codon:yes gene_type:complete
VKKKLLKFLLICNSIVLTTIPSLKAEEVFFELKNGDTISGELIEDESTDNKKIILHPILGRLEINDDSIYEDELQTDQKFWSGDVLIGLDSNHNQYYKNSGFSVESEVEYEGEKNLLNFEIEFNYGSENDIETGGKLSSYDAALIARNDYLLTDKFTVYTSSDYYFDSQSHAGKHDIEGSVGLGFFLLKNEISDFQISLGPALIWTEGGEDCSITLSCGDLIYATNLEATFVWLINKQFEFDLNNTYTNANGEGDRAISSNRLELELKFYPDVNSNLFSAIGYENIYHDLSDPEPENAYKLKVGTSF